jgi:putative heme-binding domain-containing protein
LRPESDIVGPRVVIMRARWIFTTTAMAFAIVLGIGGRLTAQEGHGVTPVDLERGGQTYLSNCTSCHGPNGDGVTGVNLFSGQFRKATTDEDLVNIIRRGIPGTPMPPFNFQEAQAGQIVAYLRSQPATAATSKLTGLRGNPANGKAIFEGKGEFEGGSECLSCHRLQTPSGKIGGFLGPDLSSIGATRRSIDLEHALTEPSAAIRTDERVVVVMKDGKTLRGRLLNQDTYSVQLIDNGGALQSIQKSNVRQVDILTISVMPNFADKLKPQELVDLVSYLGTLKAPISGGAGAGRGRQ